MRISTAMVCLAAVLPPWPSAAQAQFVIDFEEFDLNGELFLDVPETLVIPHAGGSGTTVTIEGGVDNRVYDLFLLGGEPEFRGQALIDWEWPRGANPDGTIILFDRATSFVQLDAGDFGSDDDSPMRLTAFDADDNVIGFDSVDWPEHAHPPFATLSVDAPGIRKVHFVSGGEYPDSVFIDNIAFVPEPATACLLMGLVVVLASRQRRDEL